MSAHQYCLESGAADGNCRLCVPLPSPGEFFKVPERELLEGIEKRMTLASAKLEPILSVLVGLLEENKLRCAIDFRVKSLGSIHFKMLIKARPPEKIYDLLGIRFIVDSAEDCYRLANLLHMEFDFVASEFDDYIAKPKNNYRSLHTVLKWDEETAFEVQIRTQKMHEDAERGSVSHWQYKIGLLQHVPGFT
ncbi:MAG TPA: hypothetical protein HA252_06310 [Candidatus Diapherotrites archaeon]|uniref:RelA/SpoT domain-containing protein n=1 Tax=Candidatus Iainarchaeum sp. TaxID=3101447 RepID=A0A7J4JJG6_9ARCH|nr:hypothetical protein [Candidatus Diapherotrites archaeon]HIH16990.1 hypothetical protein [Candidatus Diapherotrites archaeon]